jgi:hypothetical protein
MGMSMIALAWGGLGGTGFNFTDAMNYLTDAGFIYWVLPFLVIFAVVFAILSAIPIFKDNRGAGVIIALAVGLLSLVGGWAPNFFMIIFPNFAVGMSIVLVGLLLAGGFITSETAYKWIFFGLGGVVFLFVLFSSLSNWSTGNGFGYWWDQYAGLLIFIAILIGVIVAVTSSQKAG